MVEDAIEMMRKIAIRADEEGDGERPISFS